MLQISTKTMQRHSVIQNALLILTVTLPWTQCAVLRCDSQNRDPCTKFPSLCKEGGGLCVITAPCEYECVCPPDGRRGRDCSQNGPVPSNSKEADQSAANTGSHVESLLVFPKDLFWDMNHVVKPLAIQRITSPLPFIKETGKATTTTATGASTTKKPLLSLKESQRTHVDSTSAKPIAVISALQLSAAKSPNDNPTSTLSNADNNGRQNFNNSGINSGGLANNEAVANENSDNTDSIPATDFKSNVASMTTPSGSSTGNTKPEANQNHHPKEPDMIKFVTTGFSTEPVTTSIISVANAKNLDSLISGTATHISIKSGQSKASTDASSPSSQGGGPQTERGVSTSHEPFPGHDMFPTFFKEQGQEKATSGNERPNAPLSFVVQRVFHRPELFPVFRRNRQ